MKVIYDDYKNISNNEQITVTLGNFDGIHRGHQHLINRMLGYHDTKHAVLTFDPHPSSILRRKPYPTLIQREDKIKLLSEYNIDYLFIVKFTEDFSRLSVMEFIEFLRKIGTKRIVMGRDGRFAYRGEGSVADLKKYFIVDVMDDYVYNHTRVSTTYIKDYLQQGDLDAARKLLSRHYMISGEVVHGDKIGKQLGFPTANIDYGNYFLPKNGIYFVKVGMDGKIYPGVANVGNNPTLNFSQVPRLEVFILDFQGDVYKKYLNITFMYYIREEKKFNTREELVAQIKNDEELVRKLLNQNIMI